MRTYHSSVPASSVLHVSCSTVYNPDFQIYTDRLCLRLAREFIKNQQIDSALAAFIATFLRTPERKLISPEVLMHLEYRLTPAEVKVLADLRRWLLRVSVRRSQRGTPAFIISNLNSGAVNAVIALP